jgi:hypothetical protein
MVRIGYAENEQDALVGFGREFDPYFTAVPHIADIRSSMSRMRRIAADQPRCLSTGDRPTSDDQRSAERSYASRSTTAVALEKHPI